MEIKLSEKSSIRIESFETIKEVAELTLGDLCRPKVAISGGSTYDKLFTEWVKLKPDCSNTSFFSVDERKVSFDDPASNWGNAYRKFLSKIKRQEDKSNFAESAASYLKNLQEAFSSAIPVFDMVFLGVGDDGHTASLFPNSAYLDDYSSVVLETISPKPPFERVTLAPLVIQFARKVVTVIDGENKKNIFSSILAKDQSLPIVKMLSMREESMILANKDLM